MSKAPTRTPKVILVGSGPGDPDLLTLKAVKALEKAPVVLYDALVNESILDHAPNALEGIRWKKTWNAQLFSGPHQQPVG